jgi:hypothetical protein
VELFRLAVGEREVDAVEFVAVFVDDPHSGIVTGRTVTLPAYELLP